MSATGISRAASNGLWMLSVNVGCAGPGDWVPRSRAMSDWIRRAIEVRQPALIFAQEVTGEFLDAVRACGYDVVSDPSPRWKVRSALASHSDFRLDPLSEEDFPSLAYHGSYLAAAVWLGSPLGDVTVVSVHASPKHAEPAKYGWPGELPEARHGGGDARYAPKRLWDSDLVLQTLAGMAASGRTFIAAGDFNESLNDDLDAEGVRRGTWGREYFDRMSALGLSEIQMAAGLPELATYGSLQLDHFVWGLADERPIPFAPVVELDLAWSSASSLSDHVPLWLHLSNIE